MYGSINFFIPNRENFKLKSFSCQLILCLGFCIRRMSMQNIPSFLPPDEPTQNAKSQKCMNCILSFNMVKSEKSVVEMGKDMTKEVLNFAVIGTGLIVERFIMGAEKTGKIKIQAVYSRTMERGKQFAEKFKIEKVYDDLYRLAEDKEIQAVYIASPTSCHANQAILMMRNKKHVLCEKPIASNSHELERMLYMAEENHVVLLEAIRTVFTPGYEMIKKRLPELGTIRRITLNYCQYSSRYDKFKKGKIENAFRPELSNGAIMDIGVYCAHFLVSLFGAPYSLSAKGIVLPGSIDGMGTLTGKYKDMQAEIIYSKITNSYTPSEIQGEKGNIVFYPVAAPAKLRFAFRDGKDESVQPDLIQPDMYYEIEAFLRMVRGEESQTEYNGYSTAAIQLLDDARKQMDIVFPADY